MLLAYLTDAEKNRTIPVVVSELHEGMRRIKREAESLEYSEVTDEVFQHQIASLCVYVTQLEQRIEEAKTGVDRFIENSVLKLKAYFDLYQDLLRLISRFTTTTLNCTKSPLDYLNRVPKLEQNSVFNVIKITSHSIDMQYRNKALVIPDQSRYVTTSTTSAVKEPIVLDFLKEDGVVRDTILDNVRETIEAFHRTQNKLSVYRNHYRRLGNKELVKKERALLDERLNEVIDYVQYVGESSSLIVGEIEGVRVCFDEMIEILNKECANCHDYSSNVLARFEKCSLMHSKLLGLLREHQVDLPCLKSELSLSVTHSTESTCLPGVFKECSSMF